MANEVGIAAPQPLMTPRPNSTWAYGIAAFGLGALAALAFAPWHWLFTLVLAFSGLMWLLDRAGSLGQAFGLGWLFGLGHFIVSVHWVAESFQVDAARFGMWGIPAVLVLSAYLAMYPAIACLVTRAVGGPGPGRILIFAAAWTISELLRASLFTGFPWNLVAYVWTPHIEVLQAVSLVGVYGLGFATVALAASPRLMITANSSPHTTAWLILMLALAYTTLWLFGNARLSGAPDGHVPNVRLRLIQASIPQQEKSDPAMRDKIIDRYRTLSALAAPISPGHIVWPESAMPFHLTDGAPELAPVVSGLIAPSGVILTGADRLSGSTDELTALHNALVAVDETGTLQGLYDKAHLVPFGEYVPLRNMLPFPKLTAGTIDFVPGSAPNLMSVPGLPPFAVMICYEAIFSARRQRPGAADAAWILNVTNDAWFGTSAGPYQHFEMARVRAVESGVPLVRVANTGITAVVDSYGRIERSTMLNQVAVVDTGLPLPIEGRTLYSRMGDDPIALTLMGFVGAAALMRQRRRQGASLRRWSRTSSPSRSQRISTLPGMQFPNRQSARAAG